MSLRSPLGWVRGLGSAKEGTGHFWAQRVTAVALIPLTFLFVVVIFNFVERTDTEVPTVDYPTPPAPFRETPTNHRRLYPPPTE